MTTPPVEVTLGRLAVRPFRWGDARRLIELAGDQRVWLRLRDSFPHPYTPADAESWLELVRDQDPLLNYAIAFEGLGLVGGIGLVPCRDVYRHTAELGYWLGVPFWGRGWMTTVVGAFSTAMLDAELFDRIEARVFSSNPASARVLEKSGFEREAVLKGRVHKAGERLDEWVYARISGPAS